EAVQGAPVGVAAELTEVRQPRVGPFDRPAHAERHELLGGGGAAGSDLGAHEVVDAVVGNEAAYDTGVVAAVEVQGLALHECYSLSGGGQGGGDEYAVVPVGAIGGPADGDAVPVGEQRPLPAAFAPVNGAGTGPFAARGSLVLAAVDRAVAEIKADDPVIAGDGLVDELVEHARRDPVVAAGPQGGIGGRAAEQTLGVDPRAARHQTDQDALEADPIGDPRAVTAQRVAVGYRRDERLDRGPDSIDHFGV